jgi:hypothetical protein
MMRILLRANFFLAVLLLLVYLGDTAALHLRKNPYSTITVQHYFVIGQKNNKFEVQYDRDIDRPCANTLFPHSGYPPCWYLRRHKEQQTKI